MTKLQANIEYFQAKGYREAPTTSRKYRKFAHGSLTVWLGKSGAVRVGPTIADSYSYTDRVAHAVKREAARAMAEPIA